MSKLKHNSDSLCKCPHCGSYDYVVGPPYNNCKCNTCGRQFYYPFYLLYR